MCDSGRHFSDEPITSDDFTLSVEQQRNLPIEDVTDAKMADLVDVLSKVDMSNTVDLGALSKEERERLKNPPVGKTPQCIIVGIDRPLDLAMTVKGLTAKSIGNSGRGRVDVLDDGRVVWTAFAISQGATNLRLFVREVNLPDESKLYVTDGKSQVWGPYLPAQRPFWTHTIFGDRMYVQVQIPATGANRESNSWLIPTIAHMEEERDPGDEDSDTGGGQSDPTAIAPAAERGLLQYCRPASPSGQQEILFEKISRAVAKLRWPTGGGFHGLCSGGLLRDGRNSGTPFLLTANHCFHTQGSASNLEAIFNYVRPCGGSVPAESTCPRTLGATLLATSDRTDFTLLQLRQRPPAGAHFCRWTKSDISTTPTRLYRISHPGGAEQHYTIAALNTNGGACGANFLHSTFLEGSTAGGSSGSLLLRAAGNEPEVVGQLYGWCPPSIDGSFARTYPSVQQFLGELSTEPGEGPNITFVSSPDVATAGTRFSIQARVTDPNGVLSVAMYWESSSSTFTCPGTNDEDWWCTHEGDLYTWTILLGESLNERRYYVTAMDSQGNSSVSVTKTIRVIKPPQGQILFVSDRDRSGGLRDIYRINADGTGIKRLTVGTGNEQNYAPHWSPDGEYIVFISDRGGNPDLYIMDAEGGNQHVLAPNVSNEDQPTWGNKTASPTSPTRGI